MIASRLPSGARRRSHKPASAPGIEPGVCRALELRGSVVSAAGDTLVLGAPLDLVGAPGEPMCAFERGQRVRVVAPPSDVSVLRADVAPNVVFAFAGAAILAYCLKVLLSAF